MNSGQSSCLSNKVIYWSFEMSVTLNSRGLLKKISLDMTSFCSFPLFRRDGSSDWFIHKLGRVVQVIHIRPLYATINLWKLLHTSCGCSHQLQPVTVEKLQEPTVFPFGNLIIFFRRRLLIVWHLVFKTEITLVFGQKVTLLMLFTGTHSRLMYALIIALSSLSDFLPFSPFSNKVQPQQISWQCLVLNSKVSFFCLALFACLW